jgi:hypothetical protein
MSEKQPTTEDIIETTLRHLEATNTFMPGAASRIAKQLDRDWFQFYDTYAPGWVEQAERLINSEKLTLEKLKEHNVTIKELIGWQEWMIFRDHMV